MHNPSLNKTDNTGKTYIHIFTGADEVYSLTGEYLICTRTRKAALLFINMIVMPFLTMTWICGKCTKWVMIMMMMMCFSVAHGSVDLNAECTEGDLKRVEKRY